MASLQTQQAEDLVSDLRTVLLIEFLKYPREARAAGMFHIHCLVFVDANIMDCEPWNDLAVNLGVVSRCISYSTHNTKLTPLG